MSNTKAFTIRSLEPSDLRLPAVQIHQKTPNGFASLFSLSGIQEVELLGPLEVDHFLIGSQTIQRLDIVQILPRSVKSSDAEVRMSDIDGESLRRNTMLSQDSVTAIDELTS